MSTKEKPGKFDGEGTFTATATRACTCQDIQAAEPLRHFKGCPRREPLPPGYVGVGYPPIPAEMFTPDPNAPLFPVPTLDGDVDVKLACTCYATWLLTMCEHCAESIRQERERDLLKTLELQVLLREAVTSAMLGRFPQSEWLKASRVKLGMTCPGGHDSSVQCGWCTPPL